MVLAQSLSRDGLARVIGHSYPASAANCWSDRYSIWSVAVTEQTNLGRGLIQTLRFNLHHRAAMLAMHRVRIMF